MPIKKGILGALTVIVMVAFVAITAQNAASVVAGGKHDLSIGGAANFKHDNDEVCVFCHTPHGANRNQTYTTNPNTIGATGSLNGRYLWNRALPANSFAVYTSASLNVAVGQPGTLSLLCLSCHDGIGAMNVLVNNPVTGQPAPFGGFVENQFGDFASDGNILALNIGQASCTGDLCTGGVNNGTNLQNDHPIGFSYDTAQGLDTAGLRLRTSLPAVLQTRLNLTTTNNVECSTCHDPHIDNNPGGNMFLVMSNTSSAMCLACHNK